MVTLYRHGYSDEESREEDDDDDKTDKSCSFLFVHQEPWQQRLQLRYGNILALLDATYKTTKYSLPLFLLCVRTNCGYIPVGQFIVEQERALLIAEALMILSEWSPPYFMIDYSEAELNAISSVFPTSQVYLSDFHREKAWSRWMRSGNGICNSFVSDLFCFPVYR